MLFLDKVAAILLDMDGTLVDSDAAVERAWRSWSAEYGVDPEQAVESVHGPTAEATVRRLCPQLSDAQVAVAADRQMALQYEDLSDVVATPGASELLSLAERLGLPWGVVTSADRKLAHARLAAAGITPPVLVTLDDVRHGKPDPEGYLSAAAKLGVDPATCLVVEDSLPGLEAGRRAGAHTASLRGLPADLELTDLNQLAWLLARSRKTRDWWTDTVGYQVYLPSFHDTDGDGWGDLPGVTRRLDHLVELGVDVVWLTPFFVSPMRDHGYDIADYLRVAPAFGGGDALDELLRQAHRRGLRVMGDLVVNHTSDQHPWFRDAEATLDSPYRDYYIWRDPAPDGGPPNNWLSHFGGPAWTRSPATGQYYLHLFSPQQPDLNWHNPKVADEIDAVLDHWFTRGLDGFRIDTAAYLVKHPELPDNPVLPDGTLSPVNGATLAWRGQDHRYDIHQPSVHTIHERWRRVADRHDGFLVGEIYELDPHALADYVADERLHSAFWFGLLESDWDPGRVNDMIISAASASPRLSWAQGNHDRARAATRYGGGPVGRRRSLAMHALMAFLPGTMWIYQGEELGLPNGTVPDGHGADPLALSQPDQGRDVARTPMPWDDGLGLGFTTGTPWLPLGGRRPADTVAAQRPDPTSHLSALRRLLSARRVLLTDVDEPAITPAPAGRLTGYRRGHLRVLANLTDEPVPVPMPTGTTVFDTDDPTVTMTHRRPCPASLAAQQAIVLVDEPQ
ncbi:HAD-IA family hydrolase [Stackebrandtia nassauensis]|uniref:HAD-superfamily hydrolase, subfamily IA, variant 3 n=1 Tax=Stackebrandtia nassauensis (strain DSM 44728 / CIP 108903 / NRRL B-16338 / NBRC 102104 / LLR-40K-21) TaxID=446470 RepID=D3PUG1_STANL|nr:HAD-IA family hydrolase [Stackebrandtia nassauensis]ADD42974.1 HAD-superfamily hydrolase, subfamily IA, variant 3 [Stackebrandtia nassauensis DSM 44728]